MDGIKGRIEALKACEQSRDRIIEDLSALVESLEKDVQRENDEVRRERTLSHAFQRLVKDREFELDNTKRNIAKLSYISVLIDGDCMNFNDRLVQDGAKGGREAVQMLKRATGEHLRKIEPSPTAGIAIRIRVYANMKGLAKAYRDAGIINDTSEWDFFIQGFNMADGLCDFVDAGSGKECSDEKLRASFNQDIIDVHCHHIIFGASADNGYARLLGPHRGSTRVTLIEGTPFAHELAELKTDFDNTPWPDIFRSSKLPSRRVSFTSSMTPPRSPSESYASVVRAPQTQTHTEDILAAGTARPIKILRNAKGQRIDLPLRYYPRDVVELKQRKLCNSYHILGDCSFKQCSHQHGKRLSGQQLEALKHIARRSRCPYGVFCDSEDCTAGHHCSRDDCDGTYCKFPSELHGIDTKAVAQ